MKHAKLLLILSLVLLLVVACVACTEDGPETPTDADTAATADATDAPTEAPTATPTETAPVTVDDATDPATEPATDPATEPETEPATDPATEPETEPATDPATEPETEPTPDPLPVVKTKTTFVDWTGRSGRADISGNDGWAFGVADIPHNFADGKLVVTNVPGALVLTRLATSQEQRDVCNAAIATADAVGFYIENNSDEAIGACYFGEMTRPDLPDAEHQSMYVATLFSNIECYLIDETGKVTKGTEYWHNDPANQDHGLCEIPAHFKGYYIVTLKTTGHDQCIYAAWGGHSAAACGNGQWIDGANITNVGFSLLNCNPGANDSYSIGEFILVDFE